MSKDLLKRAEEESDYMKSMVNPAGAKDRAAWAALIQELHDKIKGDAERLESEEFKELLGREIISQVEWNIDENGKIYNEIGIAQAAINVIKGDDNANG